MTQCKSVRSNCLLWTNEIATASLNTNESTMKSRFYIPLHVVLSKFGLKLQADTFLTYFIKHWVNIS